MPNGTTFDKATFDAKKAKKDAAIANGKNNNAPAKLRDIVEMLRGE